MGEAMNEQGIVCPNMPKNRESGFSFLILRKNSCIFLLSEKK